MANYQPKNELTSRRALRVQRLCIPFFITSNATPASKTVTRDEAQMLFLNVEGIAGITLALGAVDTAAELSAITFTAPVDTTGILNALVRVGEQVTKVMSVKCVKRNATEITAGTAPTGATAFITSLGDKIVVNVDTATNFATTDGDYVLEIEYATN